MAILNFPNNPQQGDQYTGDNGTTYIFDGVKWVGHAAGGAAGTNSIQNGTNTVQVDGDGNLVTPAFTIPNTAGTTDQVLTWPGSGTTLVWADQQGGGTGGGSLHGLPDVNVSLMTEGQVLTWDNTGSLWVNRDIPTRWDATAAEPNGCQIFAELTPEYFKAATQKSHIDLFNNGDWDIGSQNLGHYIRSRPTLDSSNDIVIHNVDNEWLFGEDGNLTLPNGTAIGDKTGTEAITLTASDTANINSVVGTFPGLDFSSPNGVAVGWLVNGPGVTNATIIGIDVINGFIEIDGGAFQVGESYTFTGTSSPISIGTKITVNSNEWLFGEDGTLKLPGAIDATGGPGLTVNTDRGALKIGDSDVEPTGTSHFHIRMDQNPSPGFPGGIDLFFGDDDQFLRLANDGTVAIQARVGSESPTVITGSPTNISVETSITNITHGTVNVPVVTVADDIDIQDSTKVFFDGITTANIWQNVLNGHTFYARQVDSNAFEIYNDSELTSYTSVLTYPAWDVSWGGAAVIASLPGDVIITGASDLTTFGDHGSIYLETEGRGTINLYTENGGFDIDKHGAINLSGYGLIRNYRDSQSVHLVSELQGNVMNSWYNTHDTGPEPGTQATHSNYMGVDSVGSWMGSWDNVIDNVQLLLTTDGRLRLWRQFQDAATVLGNEDSIINSRKSIELKSERVYVNGTLDMSSAIGWATEVGGPYNIDGAAPYAGYSASLNVGDFVYAVGSQIRDHNVAQHGQTRYSDHIITKFDKTGSIVWSKKLTYTGPDSTVYFQNSQGFSSIVQQGPDDFYTTLNFVDAANQERSLVVRFDTDGNQPNDAYFITNDDSGEGYQFAISDATKVEGGYAMVGESWSPQVTLTEGASYLPKSGPGILYTLRSNFGDDFPLSGYYETDGFSEYYIIGNSIPTARINYVNLFDFIIPNAVDPTQLIDLQVKKNAVTGELSINDWGSYPTGFEPGDTYIIPGAWVGNNSTLLTNIVETTENGGRRIYFPKDTNPTLDSILNLTTNPVISAWSRNTGYYYRVTGVGTADLNNWYVELDRNSPGGNYEWYFEVSTNDITLTVGSLNDFGYVILENIMFSGPGDTDILKLSTDQYYTDFSDAGSDWTVYETKGNDALVILLNGINTSYGASDDDGINCVVSHGDSLYVGGYSYNNIPEGYGSSYNQYVGAVAKINNTGDIVWQKMLFDDSGSNNIYGITVSTDGNLVYVAGTNDDNSLIVACYSAASGHQNWMVRMFEGDPINAYPPTIDFIDGGSFAANDLFITCGGNSVTSNYDDLFVIRLSAIDGQVRWMRTVGTDEEDITTGEGFRFNGASVDVESNTFTISGSTYDRFGRSTGGGRTNGYVLRLPLDGSGMGVYPIDMQIPDLTNSWIYQELQAATTPWDTAQAHLPRWEYFNEYFENAFPNIDLNWTKLARDFGFSNDPTNVHLVNDLLAIDSRTSAFLSSGVIDNVYEINFAGGAKIITDEEGLIISAPSTSEYAGLWYGEDLDNGPVASVLVGSEGDEDGSGGQGTVPDGNKVSVNVEEYSWYFDDTGTLRLAGDVTDVDGNSIILSPGLTLNQNNKKAAAKDDIEMSGNYQGVVTQLGSYNHETYFLASALDSAGENTYLLGESMASGAFFVLAVDKLGNELWRTSFSNIDPGNNNYSWYPNILKLFPSEGQDTIYIAGQSNDGGTDGLHIIRMLVDGTIISNWKGHNELGSYLSVYDLAVANSTGNPIVVGSSYGEKQLFPEVAPVVVATTYYVVSGGQGYKSSLSNVAVSGSKSGNFMTVDVASNGVAVTAVTVNTQGFGYQVGDTLYIQHTVDTLQAGYNFMGDWSAPFGASANDVVNYNSRSYVCTSSVYGSTPPDQDTAYIEITAVVNLTSYYDLGSSEGKLVVNLTDVGGNTHVAPWDNNDWEVDVDGSGNWQNPVRLTRRLNLPTDSITGAGQGLIVAVGYDTSSNPPSYAEIEQAGYCTPVDYVEGEIVSIKGSLLGGTDTTARHINVGVNSSGYVVLTNVSTLYFDTTANPQLSDVTSAWFVIDVVAGIRYPITDVSVNGGNFVITCTGNVDNSTVSFDNGGNDCVFSYSFVSGVNIIAGLSGPPATPTTMIFDMDLGLNIDFSLTNYAIRRQVSGQAFVWTPNWQSSWGGVGNDKFNSVAYCDSNQPFVYAAGTIFDTVAQADKHVVYCFNMSNGSIQWSKEISDNKGAGDVGSIMYDNNTATLVLLSTDGNGHAVVTKLNRDTGELVWQVAAVDRHGQGANGWYDYPTAAIASDGSIVLGGVYSLNAIQGYGFLFTKIDTNGNHVWSNYMAQRNNHDLGMFWEDPNQVLNISGSNFTAVGYGYDQDFDYTSAVSVKLPIADVWDPVIYNLQGKFKIASYTYYVAYETVTSPVVADIELPTNDVMFLSPEEMSVNTQPLTDEELLNAFVIGNATPGLVFNDGSIIKTAGTPRACVDKVGNQSWGLYPEGNGTFMYFSGNNWSSPSTITIPTNANTPLPIGFTIKAILNNTNGYNVFVNAADPATTTVLATGQNPGCSQWAIGNSVPGVYTITKIDTECWIIEGWWIQNNC